MMGQSIKRHWIFSNTRVTFSYTFFRHFDERFSKYLKPTHEVKRDPPWKEEKPEALRASGFILFSSAPA